AHYKEVVTRDANGQVSLAYKDMTGKVIATALAGDAPTALDTIPGRVTFDLTDTLSKTTFQDDTSIVTEEFFTVKKRGNYYLKYDLSTASFSDCLPSGFCMDCVYNLNISVKNSCGEEMLRNGNGMDTVIGRKHHSGSCVSVPVHYSTKTGSDSIVLDLPIGSYKI
ncbi:MAG: hypothetical protein NTX03_00010, partial [Bacteroidetes bacterium]|nr:hypothetical protein [Bacteroidota bacterium]